MSFHTEQARIQQVKELPVRLLQFETSTACNAECTFCMHRCMTRKGSAEPTQILDLIYNLAHRAVEVCPFGMQEPLLEPHLSTYLSNIKVFNPSSLTHIYTNFGVYPKRQLEQIVKWGTLDNLIISFYAPTKSLYEQLQPPLNYETTTKNIKRFVKLRNKSGYYSPRIIIDYLITPETLPYAKQFQKKWEKIVDRVGFVRFDSWSGNLPYNEAFEQETFGVPPPRVPCQRLWQMQYIHYDGTVVPCCLDFNASISLGNIHDSYETWWNSETLQTLRELHMQGKYNEIPLCKDCTNWRYNHSKEWITYWTQNSAPSA